MRRLIVTYGLPTSLLLMAVAVILMLSGASAVGFAFGLVVAGVAGVVLLSTLLYEVANRGDRYRARDARGYRGPHARGF
jgi:hypothetical protein